MNIKCLVCEQVYKLGEATMNEIAKKPDTGFGMGFDMEGEMSGKEGNNIRIEFSVTLKRGNICPKCATTALLLFLEKTANKATDQACAGSGIGVWQDGNENPEDFRG